MVNKISLKAWAKKQKNEKTKKIGVSPTTAYTWALEGRIKAEHIRKGVWVVAEDEPRPEPLRSWHKQREERIERENISH